MKEEPAGDDLKKETKCERDFDVKEVKNEEIKEEGETVDVKKVKPEINGEDRTDVDTEEEDAAKPDSHKKNKVCMRIYFLPMNAMFNDESLPC